MGLSAFDRRALRGWSTLRCLSLPCIYKNLRASLTCRGPLSPPHPPPHSQGCPMLSPPWTSLRAAISLVLSDCTSIPCFLPLNKYTDMLFHLLHFTKAPCKIPVRHPPSLQIPSLTDIPFRRWSAVSPFSLLLAMRILACLFVLWRPFQDLRKSPLVFSSLFLLTRGHHFVDLPPNLLTSIVCKPPRTSYFLPPADIFLCSRRSRLGG